MKTPIVIAASIWMLALSVPSGWAANHIVRMTTGWVFSPSSLTINAGDTVTWINEDDVFSHDANSTTGLWGTGAVELGESVTLTFATPGTYPYRDSLLYFLGMVGTLTVNEPPPGPKLIAPLLLPNGSFRFTLTNLTVGKTNVIEMSTNLLTWSPQATNVAAGISLDFTNNAARPRFFRFWQAP